MTFSLLPSPVSDAVSFPHDCINLARAILGGYACARCHAGLCEHGSELCIRCHRAISGNVRPQPKHRLVLGSIIQTAMHGVSLLILEV